MTSVLPPELLAPESRSERIAELRQRIGREWVRYVATETVIVGVPGVAVLLLWTADVISRMAAIVLFAAGCVALAVLFLYTFTRRIKPLAAQLEELELLEAGGTRT